MSEEPDTTSHEDEVLGRLEVTRQGLEALGQQGTTGNAVDDALITRVSLLGQVVANNVQALTLLRLRVGELERRLDER